MASFVICGATPGGLDCDNCFTELIGSVIVFVLAAIALPCLAMIPGAALLGIQRYGTTCMPSFSLGRILFFLAWFMFFVLFGIDGWIVWFFGGRTCFQWISLCIYAATYLVLSLWPLTFFVLFSVPITAVIYIFGAILFLAFSITVVIFRSFFLSIGPYVAFIILSFVIFMIHLYFTLWAIVYTWRWRKYWAVSRAKIIENIFGLFGAVNAKQPSQVPSNSNLGGRIPVAAIPPRFS